VSKKVLIVSAEASSALYARRLLQHWSKSKQSIQAFGVGDQAMVELGFVALGRSEEMAVVGIKEVLKHFPLIRQVFHSILAACRKEKPDVAILLDYPDFNFRLAKKLKALGIKVVYYISPQIWAWRKGRIALVKKYVDRLLVLFPFEVDFYRQHGVDVQFVGHPLLDELNLFEEEKQNRSDLRGRLGVGSNEILVGLLPGSRKSEIGHHLTVMIQAAEQVHNQFSFVKFALLVAPGVDSGWLRSQLPSYDFPLVFIQDEPLKMASVLDMAVSASGTATLVLGLMGCPMIVIYRMKLLSAWIARRFVTGVKFFSLVNLISGKQVVPELFQDEAEPSRIAKILGDWVQDPSQTKKIRDELLQLRGQLGSAGATERVAECLGEYLS